MEKVERFYQKVNMIPKGLLEHSGHWGSYLRSVIGYFPEQLLARCAHGEQHECRRVVVLILYPGHWRE